MRRFRYTVATSRWNVVGVGAVLLCVPLRRPYVRRAEDIVLLPLLANLAVDATHLRNVPLRACTTRAIVGCYDGEPREAQNASRFYIFSPWHTRDRV